MKKIKKSLTHLICVALCGIFITLSFPGITVSASPDRTYTYTFDDADHVMGVGDTATVTRDGIKMTIQLVEDGSFFKIIKCEKLIKSGKPKNSTGFWLNCYSYSSKYRSMTILNISPKAFYKSKIYGIDFIDEISDRENHIRVYGEKSFAECKKLHTIQNANAYTIFKKESFANCTNLKKLDIDYACSFERNAFKNVRAEIFYDNDINPAVTHNTTKKNPKSLSTIKKELKKAGFKKGSIARVYDGTEDKRGFARYKKIKL